MRQRIHNVCCSNSVQSRSLMVYLVNTNLTSFVVLVNWHTHYVVNNELICSICTMFLCFMLDFISCVCLFLLFNGRELAFTFANCRRNSVCRLSSVVCLWRWCALLSWLKFSAIFSPYYSSGTLVFWGQNSLVGDLNARGVVIYSDFWHLECENFETVLDRR